MLQEELLSLRGVESSQELVEENVELQRELWYVNVISLLNKRIHGCYI